MKSTDRKGFSISIPVIQKGHQETLGFFFSRFQLQHWHHTSAGFPRGHGMAANSSWGWVHVHLHEVEESGDSRGPLNMQSFPRICRQMLGSH